MARFVVGDDAVKALFSEQAGQPFSADDIRSGQLMSLSITLDLPASGFSGVEPEATGRPAYHPATLLKIYLYGYLNRVQSSHRLERECQRNVELVWLTGRLAPDFKTIPISVRTMARPSARCAASSWYCAGALSSLSDASVAIDGSKFKAVNTRDRNFTQAKMQRRLEQIDESIARYLSDPTVPIFRGTQCSEAKITSAQREDRGAAPGDRAVERPECPDDADRGQADIPDRSRRALDGHQRSRQRNGSGYNVAKCGRY